MLVLGYMAGATEQENVALIGLIGAAITTVLAPVVLIYVRRRLGSSTEQDPESGQRRDRPPLPDQLHESHAAIGARLERLERGQEHTTELMQRHMADQALATGHVVGRIDGLSTSVDGLARAVDRMHSALSDHLADHIAKDRTT